MVDEVSRSLRRARWLHTSTATRTDYFLEIVKIREVRSQLHPLPPKLHPRAAKFRFDEAEFSGTSVGEGATVLSSSLELLEVAELPLLLVGGLVPALCPPSLSLSLPLSLSLSLSLPLALCLLSLARCQAAL